MFVSMIMIALLVARTITVYCVLNSPKLRGYSNIREWDVKVFCWLMMVPIVGDIIMIINWLIFIAVYINREIFVVRK